jgi:hypothetical protein
MHKTLTSSQVAKLYVNVCIRPILQYTLHKEISYPETHLIIESDTECISDRKLYAIKQLSTWYLTPILCLVPIY